MTNQQLVVFERKGPEFPWIYLATYKAEHQVQRAASERSLRQTFAALHKEDCVKWVVFEMDEEPALNLMFRKPSYKTLARIPGAIALQLPEPDDTPRCTCGRMLAVIGTRTICTGCGAQGALLRQQQLEAVR